MNNSNEVSVAQVEGTARRKGSQRGKRGGGDDVSPHKTGCAV